LAGGVKGGIEGGMEGGVEGGVEGGIEGGVGTTRRSIAQAMRPPSNPCTMKARPSMSLARAPVVTSAVPLAVPSGSDVYAMTVHGSAVTVPVK